MTEITLIIKIKTHLFFLPLFLVQIYYSPSENHQLLSRWKYKKVSVVIMYVENDVFASGKTWYPCIFFISGSQCYWL